MPGPCLLLNRRAEACADPESRDTNYESRALPPPLDDFAANLDGAIPRYSGFLPPDYDDLPNHNGSISHYSPEFFGFPKAAVRAPSAAAPLALRASDAAVKVQ